MNFIQYVFTRQRRNFGRQCIFSDRNQLIYDQPSNYDLIKDYILRDPVHRGTQLSTQMALSECNTETAGTAHHGMLHFEGGWPKDVNCLDEEQTLRYRKKIEREESWGKQVLELTKPAMHAVLQNNAVKIYEEYFEDIPDVHLTDHYTGHEVNIFRDRYEESPRVVRHIAWHPTQNNIILATHGSLDLYPSSTILKDNYIWDIENSNEPQATLKVPVMATKIEFCPKDPNLIVGGLVSGGVAVWDHRKGEDPTSVSELETAHRYAVNALCFVHSKSNSEFYTGSIDGAIHYWDARNLDKPVVSFLADPQKTDDQDRKRSHGVTALDFEYTIPIRYMAGTTHGYIFLGNRKGVTPIETLVANFKVMSGPVRTIERNPVYMKNFLVCGDWCAKIWTEDCKDNPLIRIRNHRTEINCGVWSKGRCSLFFTGQQDGTVDFWDLIMDHHKPIYTMRSIASPVTAMKTDNVGKYLATGSKDGKIHLISMDEALTYSLTKERSLISAMFERDLRRVKLLEGRIREIKLKMATEKREFKTFDEKPIAEVEGEEEEEEEEAKVEEEEGGEEGDDLELMAARNKFIEIITEEEAKRAAKKFTLLARTPFSSTFGKDDKLPEFVPTKPFFEENESKHIEELKKLLAEKKAKDKKTPTVIKRDSKAELEDTEEKKDEKEDAKEEEKKAG